MRLLSTSVLILAAAWLAAAAPQQAAAGDRHSSVSRFADDVYDGIRRPGGKQSRHADRSDHSRRDHAGHPDRAKAVFVGGHGRPRDLHWGNRRPHGHVSAPRHRPHAAHGFRHDSKWTHRHKDHRLRALQPHVKHHRPAPYAKLPRHRIIHHLHGQRWTGIGHVRDHGRTYVIEAHDRRLKRHTLVIDAFSGNVLRVIRRR